MSDPANQLNVPSNAPIDVYRSPNEEPTFDTDNKDVSFGRSGNTVNVGTVEVVTGGIGQPVSNGG